MLLVLKNYEERLDVTKSSLSYQTLFNSCMKIYFILPFAWGRLPEIHIWKSGMQWIHGDSKTT